MSRRKLTAEDLVEQSELRRLQDERLLISVTGCVCVGCGCTELKPCPNGCRWVVQIVETGKGLCSNCVTLPIEELLKRQQHNIVV